MSIRVMAAAALAALTSLALVPVASRAQGASPSPQATAPASAAPLTAYDGRYTGTSTSAQGCKPGDFEIVVDHGKISGSARFTAVYHLQERTAVYDASGTIASGGRIRAAFHSGDDFVPVNRADLTMTGTASDGSLTLVEGGQTCGHTVTLTKGR